MTRYPEFSFIGFSSDGKKPALHCLFGPNESVTIELDRKMCLNLIAGLAHFCNETWKEKE